MDRKSLSCLYSLVASAVLTTMIGAASTQPASAAIRCEGNFQITEYGRINTPYCEDQYLAQVASQSGVSVSASAIRRNPGIKEQVCRVVGHDIRVKNTCAPYMPDSDRKYR